MSPQMKRYQGHMIYTWYHLITKNYKVEQMNKYEKHHSNPLVPPKTCKTDHQWHQQDLQKTQKHNSCRVLWTTGKRGNSANATSDVFGLANIMSIAFALQVHQDDSLRVLEMAGRSLMALQGGAKMSKSSWCWWISLCKASEIYRNKQGSHGESDRLQGRKSIG